jgi:hypothetical protein
VRACVCHVLLGVTLLSSGIWFTVNSEAKSCCASGAYCRSHWPILLRPGLEGSSSLSWVWHPQNTDNTATPDDARFITNSQSDKRVLFYSGTCSNIRLLASPCFTVRIYNCSRTVQWIFMKFGITEFYWTSSTRCSFRQNRTLLTDMTDRYYWRTLLTDMTDRYCWRALLTDIADTHCWRALLTDIADGNFTCVFLRI